MIDLNQELEDFDAYFFKRHGELPLDPSSEEYANKSYLKHEMFKAWKARAKAQAVQQSFEIGRLQDRITELLDERQDLYAQINNDQAVPTWISVKDEEPPTDTMVLICWSDSPDVQPEIDYMTCDEDLNHIWANFYKDPPTHWMHFHKVPSESGAEG
ncbi:DUF551 domain-containing protein [Acinetobacter baumannii]|uniref:DUF551 domain-containing protein n=1 Tax=Acinetobacter baumannii TaxID=470 RepID=UPI00247A4914|nr:DUF551 domain-containing protein [Acinetobacter baumannii]WGQ05140.1 DUF551 domain-containing protein [Acinetobacter baumannii]